MPGGKKHADHDHIHARQDRYLAAYRKGDMEALAEFHDTDDFSYSDFGFGRENMGRKQMHDELRKAFTLYHDLKVKSISLHGHKNFTCWEWSIKYKPAIDTEGTKIEREKAQPGKVRGCSLMWWNDEDKITKQHDYLQVRDPLEADD